MSDDYNTEIPSPLAWGAPLGVIFVDDLAFSDSTKLTPEQVLNAQAQAEALLFASGKSLSASELSSVLIAGADVGQILMTLQRKYLDSGIELVEVGGKWRFQTKAIMHYLFKTEQTAQKRLSRAALETLAIIAYCQPVTRAEIEDVRGVAVSKGTLDVLMEAGWVSLKGRRRTPGRPMTYGTTAGFLEHFGLASLDMLPNKAELASAGMLDDILPENFQKPHLVQNKMENDIGEDDIISPEEVKFHQDYIE